MSMSKSASVNPSLAAASTSVGEKQMAQAAAANVSAVSSDDRLDAESQRMRKRAHRRKIWGNILTYLVLVIVTLLILFPLFIVIITSFTPEKLTEQWPPKIIPQRFTFSNYVSLFQRLPVMREIGNAALFAIAVTVFSVFFDACAAYALSHIDFRGRGFLLGLMIATLMIPGMALLIPVYKLLASMGLVNSYWGIIIPRMADVGGIFLMRQFFVSLPRELDEAARIDGCGEFRIFWSIILPNSKSVLLVITMFNLLGNWNDLLWPLIMTSTPEERTITVGLAMLTGHGSSVTPYGVVMAGALISALPLTIVFFFVQKSFVQGIAMTGMKG